MRGIVTLAAAAAVPETVPGRDAIQAIALIVTVGTLLLQGPTLRPLARALHFDLAAERAGATAMRERATAVIRAAGPDWDDQRTALGAAVAAGTLDEETARTAVRDVDLRQAASDSLRP